MSSANRPGIFGARIEKCNLNAVHASLGVGDSLLINLERGVFAVADSPDWNPAASGEFLSKFNIMIERLIAAHPEMWTDPYDLDLLKDSLTKHTNELIAQVDISASTTFTCLFVLNDSAGMNGLIFHSGDSCIFKVELSRKRLSQISWTNMDMVGRSNKISQVELTEIDETTRFIMCSDGLQALARNQNHRNLEEILLDSFTRAEVDQIPDCLIDYYGRDIEFPDDVAILALNPNQIPLSYGLSPLHGDPTSKYNSRFRMNIVL